mmetsp:Transcript_100070/g.291878  ORF Transcript_100070/g.291878 Transcript_100070/m.291878 type:complete len:207 (+) Transcript_100070:859-1479(+)
MSPTYRCNPRLWVPLRGCRPNHVSRPGTSMWVVRAVWILDPRSVRRQAQGLQCLATLLDARDRCSRRAERVPVKQHVRMAHQAGVIEGPALVPVASAGSYNGIHVRITSSVPSGPDQHAACTPGIAASSQALLPAFRRITLVQGVQLLSPTQPVARCIQAISSLGNGSCCHLGRSIPGRLTEEQVHAGLRHILVVCSTNLDISDKI